MATNKDEAALSALSGPVLYCSDCYGYLGVYNVRKGQVGTPKAGGLCKACKRKAARDVKKKRRADAILAQVNSEFESSKSVRTVSGGLPTLGRRHK